MIQSFELSSMQYLHSVAPFVQKSMLIDKRHLPLLTHQGMTELSSWISYYSPWKELLYTGILAQIEKEGIDYDETLIDEMGGFIAPQYDICLHYFFIYKCYEFIFNWLSCNH